MSHQVSPYVHHPETTLSGAKTHDFPQWSREGAMVRIDAESILDRWRKQKAGGAQR